MSFCCSRCYASRCRSLMAEVAQRLATRALLLDDRGAIFVPGFHSFYPRSNAL